MFFKIIKENIIEILLLRELILPKFYIKKFFIIIKLNLKILFLIFIYFYLITFFIN